MSKVVEKFENFYTSIHKDMIAKQVYTQINYFRGQLSFNFNRDIPNAFKVYSKGLELSESIGFQPGIALSLHGLTACYVQQDQIDIAKEYVQRASNIETKLDYKEAIIYGHDNVFRIFLITNKFSELMEHTKKILQIAEEIGFLWGIMVTHYSLAFRHLQLGNLEESLILYKKALF